MPRFGKALPVALREGLIRARVDLIVHCGDIVDAMALRLFEELAPVQAVAGNNDPPALVEELGRKKILQLGSVRIGLVHGDAGIGSSTLARAQNTFRDEPVDAILFGHSHVPHSQHHNGILMFNPGSPTDKRRQPQYSYGILQITAHHITPTLHYYPSK
jgi:hypothetical protein